MPLSGPSVVILSSDPVFARELAAHWPSAGNAPEFTVLEQGRFAGGNYDLAIAESTSSQQRIELRQSLTAALKPAIVVYFDSVHSSWPQREAAKATNVIELSGRIGEIDGRTEKPMWPVIAALLGHEILERCQAERRAHEARLTCDAAQRQAELGRYIVEMRHNINNALTSVLGNAELLTLETGLPANALSEAETILNMALRLHEVFRRFASLEAELSVGARQTACEPSLTRSVASGT